MLRTRLWGLLLSLTMAGLLGPSSTSLFAQPGGGPPDGGRRFGREFGRMVMGPSEVALRDDVRGELKLTDEQVTNLEKLRDDARESMRAGFDFRAMRDMSETERRAAFEKLAEKRIEQNKVVRGKVQEILSAEQRSRFAELEFQLLVERGAIADALAAAGIPLDDTQKETLRTKQEESEKQTREQIAELQRKANEEVLASVLAADQSKRLAGNPFKFSVDERGPFGFGPPFGPGGPGREGRGNREGRRPRLEDDDNGGDRPRRGRRDSGDDA